MASYMVLTVLVIVVFTALFIWRLIDEMQTNSVWKDLKSHNPPTEKHFNPDDIQNLPEPVRRFFLYSIKPGTALRKTAELKMIGELSLGTKANPKYLPMYAHQILSPPHGFIWKVSAGRGLMKFSGSDAAHPKGSWSRFWLFGLIPIARAGGSADHFKSSFGRYMCEAIFWLPGAILPSENIKWQKISQNVIQVTVKQEEMELSADLTLNTTGQPTQIQFERWSNANPDKIFRWQSFGGYLSEFREFDGYMLPTKIEAGNFFNSDEYFPFFKAKITDIIFPSR